MTEITVYNNADLSAAIDQLSQDEGGTILVAASDARYSVWKADFDGSEQDSPITIRSADPDNPAVFSRIFLSKRENLTFDNLKFDAEGIASKQTDLEIRSSTDIRIINSAFNGGGNGLIDGSEGDIRGNTLAYITNTDGFVFSNNYAENYWNGVAFDDSNDIAFSQNEFTQFQADGLRIAGVQDADITENWFHDFAGASSNMTHGDLIQFWGINTAQSTERVNITANVLDTGLGSTYQGIFGNNIYKEQFGFVLKDVVLRDNVLITASPNMVVLSDTVDAIFENNTVLYNPQAYQALGEGVFGSTSSGWVRIEGDNPVVRDNIAMKIVDEAGDNIRVNINNVSSENYYAKHFTNFDGAASGDLRDLELLPDSPWNGVGSSLLWARDTADDLMAVAVVQKVPGDQSFWMFDARLSRDENGYVSQEDASFRWSFADGTVLYGRSITHDFATTGTHNYSLEIEHDDGSSDRIERTVTVIDPLLFELDFDAENGVSDLSDHAAKPAVNLGSQGSAAVQDGVFVMDGNNSITFSRGASYLYNLDSFTFSMTLDVGSGGTSGYIMSILKDMTAEVRGDGSVAFWVETSVGRSYVSTGTETLFDDAGTHHLDFVFDGIAETLNIYVDGELSGSVAAQGITQAATSHNLIIGKNFRSGIEGEISNVKLLGEARDATEIKAAYGDLFPDNAEPGDEADPGEETDIGDETGPGEETDIGDEADIDSLVDLRFEGDLKDSSASNAKILMVGTQTFAEGPSGLALHIGGGDALSIDRSNSFLYNLDAFDISLDFQSEDGAEGNLLVMTKTLRAFVRNDDLTVNLITDEGSFWASTGNDALKTTDWQNVAIGYSDEDEILQITVDGALEAESHASGQTAPGKYWGLTAGSRWGGLDATIDNLQVSDQYDMIA